MSSKTSKTYKFKSLLVSASLLMTALTVSGCSNFTRFDFPIFGLDKEEDQQTTSSVNQSASYEGVNRVYPPLNAQERQNTDSDGYYRSIYDDRKYRNTSSIPDEYSEPSYNSRQESYRSVYDEQSTYRNQSERTESYGESTHSNGSNHIVKRGDNLYRIALNNNVNLAELKRVNGLTGNTIHVGQQLIIPGAQPIYQDYGTRRSYRSTRKPSYSRNSRLYDVPRTRNYRTSSRKVQSQRRNRRVASLHRKSSRSLRPTRKVRRKPASRSLRRHSVTRPPEAIREKSRAELRKARERRVREARERRERERREREIRATRADENSRNADRRELQRHASLPKKQETIDRQSKREVAGERIIMPRTSGRFRWPVKGRIISKFGIKRDGARNDGINLSVPFGTEVRAAEAGVVAYAGNELKGYGNLVLIRHKNKWVTAYAHNSKVLVRRGQRVRRGQVIANAGKSGSVSQPQVHFELRKGDKPVDPLKYM